MKPTFSPDSTADLTQAIALMERAYRREMGCESSFHMSKLSGAIGEVMFVAQSTSRKPVITMNDVRVVMLDEVGA